MSKKHQSTAAKAANEQLRSYVERIELLNEEKKTTQEDIKSIMQEAKAAGYDTKALRAVVKIRRHEPAEWAEAKALIETYLSALGMADAPLFASVGAMAVDTAARDSIIAAFKQLVPTAGEVIIKFGGSPIRLYRDKDGNPRAEDYVESAVTEPPIRPGKKIREPATVLTMVPRESTAEQPPVDNERSELDPAPL